MIKRLGEGCRKEAKVFSNRIPLGSCDHLRARTVRFVFSKVLNEQWDFELSETEKLLSIMSTNLLKLKDRRTQLGGHSILSDSKLVVEFNEVVQEIERLESFRGKIDDLSALYKLSEEENDSSLQDESLERMEGLKDELRCLLLDKVLSQSEHDSSGCYLQIQAGTGGQDAFDWVKMLNLMYKQWAVSRGSTVRTVEKAIDVNNSNMIRSVTMLLKGENTYGLLKAEAGVHRLVRISPFGQFNNLPNTEAQRCVFRLFSKYKLLTENVYIN